MNIITLRLDKSNNTWMANFLDDDYVRSLFGTTELPTGYTGGASADYVTCEITRLNPGHKIICVNNK